MTKMEKKSSTNSVEDNLLEEYQFTINSLFKIIADRDKTIQTKDKLIRKLDRELKRLEKENDKLKKKVEKYENS